MVRQPKNTTEVIKELHDAYNAKQLKIIVGAGVSRASGIPTWDELNRKLLSLFLAKVHGSAALADELYMKLGREAVAEFVLRSMEARKHLGKPKPSFGELLSAALYGGRKVAELPLTDTQYRLASMAGTARLYTTNFDPLLELAIDRLDSTDGATDDWKKYRLPTAGTEQPPSKKTRPLCVYHVHGWLGENGRTSPSLVFTESHYHALSLNRTLAPAKMMRGILSQGYTLILGMSLEDPNLRRVLYTESRADLKLPNSDNTVAVLRESDEQVARFAQQYWTSFGVRLVQPDRFDEIPLLLREVQYGSARVNGLLPWVSDSLARLKSFTKLDKLVDYGVRATLGDPMMRLLVSELRSRFAISSDEIIDATFFVLTEPPFGDPRIRHRLALCDIGTSESLTADSLPPKFGKTPAQVLRQRCRFLGLGPKSQGVGGISFESGITLSTTSGGAEVDRHFATWQKEAFNLHRPFRNWRNIISIPIIHGNRHLPIGVVCLTSNGSQPFWKRVIGDPDTNLQMRQAVDTTAISLLRKAKTV